MPAVSVIIPTHNRPQMLRAAIKSVLDQTYSGLEIIVIDDGLKERAKSVVEEFSDSRIRYIQHETGKGGGAARNTGIRNASGAFIAFLDDDDTWVPNKLELQLKALAGTSPEIGFCFGSVQIKTDEGTFTNEMPQSSDGNYFENALEHFSGFPTPTLMVKRSVFGDIGYFDEQLPSHQESDLMIRMTKKYRGILIPKPLAHVIMTSGHEHIGSNPAKRTEGRKMILEKYSKEFSKRPAVLSNWYFGLGLIYRDWNHFNDAKIYFKKAWQINFKLRYLAHYITMVAFGNRVLSGIFKRYMSWKRNHSLSARIGRIF